MEQIKIKKVSRTDIWPLQSISSKTFVETFEAHNSVENMQAYLMKHFNRIQLDKELANRNSAFYFAEFQKQYVGYIKLNFRTAQNENFGHQFAEIERLYVLKEFHGKKIGYILLEKASQIAKEKGCNILWLGVWEKNTAAIRFYEKQGFEKFDQHVFMFGNDPQTDFLMKKVIAPSPALTF